MSLTVPDSASVLSFVVPPPEMVPVAPVLVVIVLLMVAVGAVVSTTSVPVGLTPFAPVRVATFPDVSVMTAPPKVTAEAASAKSAVVWPADGV